LCTRPSASILTRVPIFCDTELARRLERAETRLMYEASQAAQRRGADAFALPIAGGFATYAGPDSPFNKVSGLGFDAVPDADHLAEIEQAFRDFGAPVQVELAHVADPALGESLSDRGYRLASFENVLGRPLDTAVGTSIADGIEIRPSGDEELEAWLDVVADGVAVPDTQGLPSHEAFPRDIVLDAMRDLSATQGIRRYIALRDGVLAGGASIRISDGIAQMGGAATVPAHRRRGIQTALLATRLADAASAGCDIAVVTTQPASKSQQNVQRRGFDLLYTRAVLLKEP
jgi:GNAT superfamily N-acetyltransferase